LAIDDDEFAEEELSTQCLAPHAASAQGLSTSAARRRRRQRAAERAADKGKDLKKPNLPSSKEEQIKFSEEFVDQLKNKLEAGGKQMVDALEAITGKVWPLSREAKGCRLVQLALTTLSKQQATALASEMQTRVREAISSPHANYVIQKIIETLPPANTTFIAEELRGSAQKTARHKFGCRILCRLVSSCGEEHSTKQLIKELLTKEAGDLCRHAFGHHVIQAILEHGNAEHQSLVAKALLEDPVKNATHRSASYVVEKALQYCSTEDRQRLQNRLGESLGELATSQYGCYVTRELMLHCPRVATAEAWKTLEGLTGKLSTTPHGLRLLEELAIVPPGSADVPQQ